MSELKAYKPYANRDGDVLIYHKGDGDLMLDDEDEIYLKEDADKVIAHHKHKRCLAMAEWCNSEMGRETFACFRPRHTKEVWREEHRHWAKWRKIWFELAEKFKEVK